QGFDEASSNDAVAGKVACPSRIGHRAASHSGAKDAAYTFVTRRGFGKVSSIGELAARTTYKTSKADELGAASGLIEGHDEAPYGKAAARCDGVPLGWLHLRGRPKAGTCLRVRVREATATGSRQLSNLQGHGACTAVSCRAGRSQAAVRHTACCGASPAR